MQQQDSIQSQLPLQAKRKFFLVAEILLLGSTEPLAETRNVYLPGFGIA
jgi:hypothetical protein